MKQAKLENSNMMSDMLNAFSSEVQEKISAMISELGGSNIILGYDYILFTSKKQLVEQNILHLNEMLNLYTKFLKGKIPNSDTWSEVLSLPLTKGHFINELKKRYIDWNKVAITNFPLKISKLIELFEFSTEEEGMLSDFLRLADGFDAAVSLKEYIKYFDTETGNLRFNEIHEAELLKKCTKYVNEKMLYDILSTQLFCVALNNLKTQDYSFNELPEVDVRIMSMISQDDSFGSSISVDLKNISGEGFSEIHPETEFEYLGESESTGLPIFKVNGVEYEYTSRAFSSPFKEYSEGTQKVSINILELKSVAKREAFIKYSLKLLDKGSGIIAKRVSQTILDEKN